MPFYVILKFLHVLSAIVAVGATMTYRMLLIGAKGKTEQTLFALHAIRFLDRRLANPAYLMLLITGSAMTYMANFRLSSPWLISSLILYFLSMGLGIKVYAPVFRRQINLAKSEGVDGDAYRKAARQASIIEATVTLFVMLIVFLMVTKPALW
ncbi:MAG: DUF2269 family protein [Anaerolineaceae bacterium]|jgi:uncharacterized membrane protein|nr:DUF2269 family protein [Anaerolineaceae bacterium]OQY88848.1 MAG: hypothetical protein B6D38_08470 [Anaerolineae bacterium UTCFX1]